MIKNLICFRCADTIATNVEIKIKGKKATLDWTFLDGVKFIESLENVYCLKCDAKDGDTE